MEPDPGFWSGKRVCVTGGSGLLGFQIVQHLLALGARVRVLALQPPNYHPLHQEDRIELVDGDVRDAPLVRRALDDCVVVFHAAGVVADWGPALRRMHDVHVNGTRNVLESASRTARIVVTSSAVTVGATQTGEPLTEESSFDLDRLEVEYMHAKRAAERIALQAAAAGRDVVVTNPTYLIGPEDWEQSVMGRFCTRFWKGLIPIAPPCGVNFADARDCARGHLLAAEHGRSGRLYLLGGEDRTFSEFMTLLAGVGGLRPRALPRVPAWLLATMARTAEVRARITREQPYPSVQQARLNRYYWYYRSERAARELGYRSRPLAESVADAFCWYYTVKSLEIRGPSRWWMRPDPAAGLRSSLSPHYRMARPRRRPVGPSRERAAG